jgi:polyisoprenoid-binding protein YceI
MKSDLVNKLFLSSCLMATSFVAQAENWTLTPSSKISFDIRSAGMSVVNGQFQNYQSQMSFDNKSPNQASAKFVMDVNSLKLSKSSLKDMVFGESFFYANKYKTVTFQSNEVNSLGNNKYKINGNLTLRGVTRPVSFDTTLTPQSTNPKLMNVLSTTVINRSDFGMRKALGGIGEKVIIKLEGQWKAN